MSTGSIGEIYIGSSPYDEQCAQVGSPGYRVRSTYECEAYRQQLLRMFGKEPEGVALLTVEANHEFGRYRYVAAMYHEYLFNDEAKEYVQRIESECPAKWDDKAREYLRRNKVEVR
jgi:hypothetical protein